MEQLKLGGKKRQRASAPQIVEEPPAKWHWGDDK
jgi:hypothetical protein